MEKLVMWTGTTATWLGPSPHLPSQDTVTHFFMWTRLHHMTSDPTNKQHDTYDKHNTPQRVQTIRNWSCWGFYKSRRENSTRQKLKQNSRKLQCCTFTIIQVDRVAEQVGVEPTIPRRHQTRENEGVRAVKKGESKQSFSNFYAIWQETWGNLRTHTKSLAQWNSREGHAALIK